MSSVNKKLGADVAQFGSPKTAPNFFPHRLAALT
jgi:hypothetical protein